MPWELLIVKTADAAPPRLDAVADGQRLPLGSVADVRAAIAASHDHVDFTVESLSEGRTQLIADARIRPVSSCDCPPAEGFSPQIAWRGQKIAKEYREVPRQKGISVEKQVSRQ